MCSSVSHPRLGGRRRDKDASVPRLTSFPHRPSLNFSVNFSHRPHRSFNFLIARVTVRGEGVALVIILSPLMGGEKLHSGRFSFWKISEDRAYTGINRGQFRELLGSNNRLMSREASIHLFHLSLSASPIMCTYPAGAGNGEGLSPSSMSG
jgi:hypothetical protein